MSADHLPRLQQLSQPVGSRLPKIDSVPDVGAVAVRGRSWLQPDHRSAKRPLGGRESRPAEDLDLLPGDGALCVRAAAVGFPAEGHLRGEQQVLQGRVPVPGGCVRHAGRSVRVHLEDAAHAGVGWGVGVLASRLDPAADIAGEVLRTDQYDLVQFGRFYEVDT